MRLDPANQGFTLLELMLVISIIASTCAIGFPVIGEMQAKSVVKQTANALLSFIQQAKAKAIFSHTWVDVSLIGNSESSPARFVAAGRGSHRVLSSLALMDNQSLDISSHYGLSQCAINGQSGKLTNGHWKIQSTIRQDIVLRVVTSHGASRIRICSEGEKWGQFSKC